MTVEKVIRLVKEAEEKLRKSSSNKASKPNGKEKESI